MIVVDTSVLIDLFKGRLTPAVEYFKNLERDEVPIALPAVCCQELLQGAGNEKEWQLLEEYLGSQWVLDPVSPLTTHLGAARIFFDCRRKGITVRTSTDCFIAQLCLENNATLLHSDRDFEMIRRIRPLETISFVLNS